MSPRFAPAAVELEHRAALVERLYASAGDPELIAI